VQAALHYADGASSGIPRQPEHRFMRSIADTIERLARYRAIPQPNSPSSALKKLKSHGKNPGNLSA
jgi:hypothetical protein